METAGAGPARERGRTDETWRRIAGSAGLMGTWELDLVAGTAQVELSWDGQALACRLDDRGEALCGTSTWFRLDGDRAGGISG
jgi:hypothetical protein